MTSPYAPFVLRGLELGIAEVAAELGRHSPIARLGEGMDFVTYRCEDLVLRAPKRGEVAALVDAEYELLVALPVLSLDTPRPIAAPIVANGWLYPILAYRMLVGTPLCDVERPIDLIAAGTSLGTFLRRLHRAPLRTVAPSIELARWAADVVPLLHMYTGEIGAELRDAATAVLRRELPAPASEPVMCHRDLTDEHVLIDRSGSVCGVIDFGDAGPAPA